MPIVSFYRGKFSLLSAHMRRLLVPTLVSVSPSSLSMVLDCILPKQLRNQLGRAGGRPVRTRAERLAVPLGDILRSRMVDNSQCHGDNDYVNAQCQGGREDYN